MNVVFEFIFLIVSHREIDYKEECDELEEVEVENYVK